MADFSGKQAGHTTGSLPETPRPLQLLVPTLHLGHARKARGSQVAKRRKRLRAKNSAGQLQSLSFPLVFPYESQHLFLEELFIAERHTHTHTPLGHMGPFLKI